MDSSATNGVSWTAILITLPLAVGYAVVRWRLTRGPKLSAEEKRLMQLILDNPGREAEYAEQLSVLHDRRLADLTSRAKEDPKARRQLREILREELSDLTDLRQRLAGQSSHAELADLDAQIANLKTRVNTYR